MVVLMTPVCQNVWWRKNSVEPDALVFSTLAVEKQDDQGRVEQHVDTAPAEDAASEVVIGADWGSESECGEGAPRPDDIQQEGGETRCDGQLPSETQVVGHQHPTQCIEGNDTQDDDDAQVVAANQVALDS